MKTRNTLKFFIALILAPAFYSGLHAQEFKTNESIRDQVIKGTAPGLRFAPAPATRKQVDNNKGTGSDGLISQLRKGVAPNMQFKTANSGGGAVTNKAAANTSGKLASDLPAKKQQPAAKPAAIPVPSQGDAGPKNN